MLWLGIDRMGVCRDRHPRPTVGLPLGILPRGETICAHMVTQPPNSVFLLPNLMEDWRFQESPYSECGGLRAYAGAPLRLQDESGECVALGSLCTLVSLADWAVSDIVQCARARRQRERRRMVELISTVQRDMGNTFSEAYVLGTLRVAYPNAVITLQSSKAMHIELEGRSPVPPSLLEGGLWEDTEYIDDFITNSNNKELPTTQVVRAIDAPCDNMPGASLLIVATKDFQSIFDDVDSWFVHTCASMISQMWQKILLAEDMETKEKFPRGFSHQLRTHLHEILGSVELLTEELSSRDLGEISNLVPISSELTRVRHFLGPSLHLKTIRIASRDLNAIVNSMITLNRWADTAMRDRRYLVHSIHELEQGLADEVLKVFLGDTRYKAPNFSNKICRTFSWIYQIDVIYHQSWFTLQSNLPGSRVFSLKVTGAATGVTSEIFTHQISQHGTQSEWQTAMRSFYQLSHAHWINALSSIEDSFAVTDFGPELEQHFEGLSRLPSDRVVICLVPASQKAPCTERTPDNVVYVSGPFLTSVISSDLEEADKLLSKITTVTTQSLVVDDNAVNLHILEMYCSKRGFSYCSATDGL
ncbi:histidine kinase HHK3 [Penicillium antarcticum]|uniref:histidine kinase HHK3 n=1 Tax=Penicillium antarcticum TaxID=416450 RepID=UPI00239BEA79|nr:histidine kinase HHK3 [Penicillium antarcticum]KAJ5296203.1 histidine kinase HHK3 [Penicillium antarcticum]